MADDADTQEVRARSAQAGAGVAAGGLLPPEPALRLPGAEHRRSAPPGLPRPPLTDADYWRFADWLAPYFDALWYPTESLLRLGQQRRRAHLPQRPAAHDARGRRARGPPGPDAATTTARGRSRGGCASRRRGASATRSPEGDPQFHNPGWVESLGTREAAMDKSIDPKVAEALMYAWRARDVLRPARRRRVDLIADRVSRCARGPFFRFPNVRLNQINWNCELYAHPATVTGRHRAAGERLPRAGGAVLRRHHAAPPCRAARRTSGPDTASTTCRTAPPTHPFNLDSAEYASETMPLHPLLRAGACGPAWRRSPPEHYRLLRAWVEHIVCGYWTHGGYLNWDTGYGFKRWHAGRTWALAQQGLLAIAARRGSTPRPSSGGGRSTCSTAGSACTSGCRARRPTEGHRAVQPLRRQRRAARAEHPGAVRRAHAGERRARGRARARRDAGRRAARRSTPSTRDIGRLAVTTPQLLDRRAAGQPARLPLRRHGAGRLYDGDQRVVSNVGGRPWASFGVLVRDRAAQGDRYARSARARWLRCGRRSRCWPRRAAGSRRRSPTRPRPYAGPFETLSSRRAHRDPDEVCVGHDAPLHAELDRDRWAVARRRARPLHGRRAVPLVGQEGARRGGPARRAARDAGAARAAAAQGRRCANVVYFYLAGEDSGYVVVPAGQRPRAHGPHPAARSAQSSAPRPGPDPRGAAGAARASAARLRGARSLRRASAGRPPRRARLRRRRRPQR